MGAKTAVDIAHEVIARIQEPNFKERVLAIQVPDLDAAQSILNPVFRLEGAIRFDLSEIASEGFSGAVPNPGMENAVMRALGGISRPIAYDEDPNGRRRAYWIDSPRDEFPPQELILAAATIPLYEDLANEEVPVAVLYEESQLELTHREAVWNFLTKDLPDYLQASPLICVVVGAEYPSSYQLQGETSLRCYVEEDRVRTRNFWRENRQRVHETLNAGDQSHIVLFLAAGFSASMGMPLGNGVRDIAIRRLLVDGTDLEVSELPLAFYRHLRGIGRLLDSEIAQDDATLAASLTLERVIYEENRLHGHSVALEQLRERESRSLSKPLMGAARTLRELVGSSTRKLVLLTVNFDRLVEYEAEDQIQVFANDEAFDGAEDYLSSYLAGEADASRIPLLKLHGSFSDEDASLIASIDQTLRGLQPARKEAVKRACTPPSGSVPFFYVGSSMRDFDVRDLLNDEFYAKSTEEMWVTPLPAPGIAEFIEQKRIHQWETRQTTDNHQITLTADDFMKLLQNMLT